LNFLQKHITNISSLQLFQLLRFGTLLLISIIFTKTHVSVAEIGNYELFLFIASVLSSFWVNGLIQSFLPIHNAQSGATQKKSPELFNAFLLLCFFSVIAAFFLFTCQNLLSGFLIDSKPIPYFNLLIVYILISNPSFLIEYIYLLRNRPNSILIYGVSTFAIQLMLVALPVAFGFGMEWGLWGLIAVSMVRMIWLIVILQKYAKAEFSAQFVKEHLRYGYPLILSALLGSSAEYIDGFLVLNQFDAATFAIFRYGAKEFPLVLLLANAFSNATIKEFADPTHISQGLKLVKNKSKRLMHLLFPITIVFLLTSYWLYPRIFNPHFLQSAGIFNIYLLLIISRLVFPHTIIIGFKRTKIILYASVAELLVKLIFSFVLIHLFGIKGVAFATVIAYSFQKIVWLAYNSYVLKIKPATYIPLQVYCAYSALTVATYLLTLSFT